MSGANGDALEWAVALLHAPGERHALRQRPLPDGITELLGIAAATSPESLAIAAKRFGEPESRMREAAQFYVREILLFPQADGRFGASGHHIEHAARYCEAAATRRSPALQIPHLRHVAIDLDAAIAATSDGGF